MFRQREEMRRRLYEIIEIFRKKGAVTPEKAMTAEELGLPPRFEEAMQRRLGQTGIFVKVGNKYYLSEERLKQIEEQRRAGGGGGAGWGGARRNMFTLRIVRMITAVAFVALLLVNIFVQSLELRLITFALVIVWIGLTVAQIYYLSRARRRLPLSQQTM